MVIIMVAMVIIYRHDNHSTVYLYGDTGPLRISPDTKLSVAVASHCPQGSGLIMMMMVIMMRWMRMRMRMTVVLITMLLPIAHRAPDWTEIKLTAMTTMTTTTIMTTTMTMT